MLLVSLFPGLAARELDERGLTITGFQSEDARELQQALDQVSHAGHQGKKKQRNRTLQLLS